MKKDRYVIVGNAMRGADAFVQIVKSWWTKL